MTEDEQKQRFFAVMERATELADATGKIVAVCRDRHTRLPPYLKDGEYQLLLSDAIGPGGYCFTVQPQKGRRA